MNPETVPHVYLVDAQNHYQRGAVMAKDPVLTTGPPQTVSYFIDPDARWSDGQPITSADIKYTWDQIVHGQDVYSTVGYSDISRIDTPSPTEAVAVFSKPYAAWRDLFGADDYGILPSHILAGQDRDAVMRNGYSWSGGPWLIQSWQKGQSITLVPNPQYWGKKPYLDKVVFQIITDTSTEASDYKAGRFDLVYPQPAASVVATLHEVPGSQLVVRPSLDYEGIWLNVTKAPLDDVKVRQALAYATDRNAIVRQALGSVDAGLKPLQSSIPPGETTFAAAAFSRYAPNPAMVDQLMTGAGWARGAGGTWVKNGQPATIQIKSTAGTERRALMESLLQSQWSAAGFSVSVQDESVGTLVGQDLPVGNFQTAVYAEFPASPDPGQCVLWCSADVPGPANLDTGQNWTRITDPALDLTWGAADSELNPTKRAQEVKAGQAALANLVPFIPLDNLPDVLAWRTRLRGPVGDDSSSGPFWNMEQWYLG
ncbi:MAG TPA: ABC transporter substrate-binding protein [Acidimicrobiales bacterium]|nr:ABC transporter substrate-binding protein [Acidimicrobiales bacterium]